MVVPLIVVMTDDVLSLLLLLSLMALYVPFVLIYLHLL